MTEHGQSPQRSLHLAAVLGASLVWSAPLAASPSFPGELQRQLDMPCVPQCTVCHRDGNGGLGTAVKPFGVAMKEAGLKLKEPELIAEALGVLEENRYDSDGDGVTDVDELREGRNPNQSGEGVLCATYGCSARIAEARGDVEEHSTVAIVLMLLALRSRRFRRCLLGEAATDPAGG